MLKNVQASGKPGTIFYSSNPSWVEVFLLFFISEMISLKFLRGAVLTSLLQFLGNILEDWLWSVLNNRVWQFWTSCQWIFFVENSLFSCHLWSSLMFIRSLCHLTHVCIKLLKIHCLMKILNISITLQNVYGICEITVLSIIMIHSEEIKSFVKNM